MSVESIILQQLASEPLASAKHLVVAYSGGIDSHVLLHALHRLKLTGQYPFELSAIHVHHGLSNNADKWQQHCQQVCQTLGVNFKTAKLNLSRKPRQSLEALARDGRYQTLFELAPNNSQVLLAQHQDDQLETFLLQLKRGAGPKGLAAMNRTWQVTGDAQAAKQLHFYRPLLDASQEQINHYAQQHQLNWVEDESNQNLQFERNFLRQQVLPLLQQRWPQLASTVARSAALCAEQQALLEQSCAEKLQQVQTSDNSLAITSLTKLTPAWIHQVVRYWLAQQQIPNPSMAVLQRLKPEVLEAKDDASPILQWQNWQFRRFAKQLFVIPVPSQKVDFNQRWQGEKSISLPHALGALAFTELKQTNEGMPPLLCIDTNLGPVDIRLGGFSIKFTPQFSPHSKPLKQWFKQWQVPPWDRDKAILVIQQQSLLAVYCANKWHVSNMIQPSTANLAVIHNK